MVIGDALKFLNIVGDSEAINRKKVHKREVRKRNY